MNKTLAIARNVVSKNRTAIAVVATAAICIAVNRFALRQHDDFLKEHNLLEEYYNSEM